MELRFPLKWAELLSLAGIASLTYTIMKEFGIAGWIAGGIAVFLYVLVVTIWSISRLWSSMENRFYLQPVKLGGKGAYEEIRVTRESIRVTHFTIDPPSDAYTALMLERMNQGIGVIRIVAIDPDEPPTTYAWLQQFRGHRRYTEYRYRSKPLPMDLMIFDDKKVLVSLPMHVGSKEFDQTIKFDNSRVALLSRAMFDRLVLDSELTTRPAELNKVIQPADEAGLPFVALGSDHR